MRGRILSMITSFLASLVLLVFLLPGCGSVGSSSNGDDTEFLPTWISASWSGGAAGNPTDRRDEDATDWIGSICPASSVTLTNFGSKFAGLNIINNCTGTTVTYALCVSKGSLAQPAIGGLEECATDPFDTPFSQLTFKSITVGAEGDFINSTQNLSVNVFFCSQSQILFGPPLRCL